MATASTGIQTITTELALLAPTTVKLDPASYDAAQTYTLIDYSAVPSVDLQGYPDMASLVAARLIVDSSATLFNATVFVDAATKRIRMTLTPR